MLQGHCKLISNTEYQILCNRRQQEKDPRSTRQETHMKIANFCEDLPAQTSGEAGLPPAEDSLGSTVRSLTTAEKEVEYPPAAHHTGLVHRKHDFYEVVLLTAQKYC